MDSIHKTELENKLLGLCETHLQAQGFRAVDVDAKVAGRSLIRLFIERITEAGGQTSIEDCAKVSRALDEVLETTQIVPGGYDLEVSTPGLDRRLRTCADFQAVVGSEVKLKLTAAVEGVGAAVRGKLTAVENGFLHLLASGKEVRLPLSQVSRANFVWEMKEKQ